MAAGCLWCECVVFELNRSAFVAVHDWVSCGQANSEGEWHPGMDSVDRHTASFPCALKNAMNLLLVSCTLLLMSR